MPWTAFPDTDDVVHDWLKSLYTAYRNALVDPSVMPDIDAIDWDSFWSGMNAAAFIVYEERTDHRNLGMGSQSLEFTGTHVIRVAYRWINAGKPPELKQFREFVTRKMHEVCYPPLPAAFTNAGIIEVWPNMTSRLFQQTNSAQEDFWVFELRFTTKVINSIV